MRKFVLGLVALAVALPAMPSAALAQRHGSGYSDGGRYERDYRDNRRNSRDDRRGNRRNDSRYSSYYDGRGYYNGPTWRGRDGRNYCHRSDGSTGLIVGAAAGALVGRGVDSHGERATGTILGALLGAVIGQSIDKDNGRRCR